MPWGDNRNFVAKEDRSAAAEGHPIAWGGTFEIHFSFLKLNCGLRPQLRCGGHPCAARVERFKTLFLFLKRNKRNGFWEFQREKTPKGRQEPPLETPEVS